jgi:hypothetical protein
VIESRETCSTYGRDEKRIQNIDQKTSGKRLLGGLDLLGRIILKLMLENNVEAFTGLNCFSVCFLPVTSNVFMTASPEYALATANFSLRKYQPLAWHSNINPGVI